MAISDVVSDLQVLTQNGTLDIQPPSGEEWLIINVFTFATIEIYFVNSSQSIFVKSISFGLEAFCQYHVTSTRWLRLKAVETGGAKVGYTGVAIK